MVMAAGATAARRRMTPSTMSPTVFQGAEGFVGDLDRKCFFDLEGDVDLIEGVDVELVEGAGQGHRVGGDVLRFCDDLNAACGDIVHGVSTSFGLIQLTGMPVPL